MIGFVLEWDGVCTDGIIIIKIIISSSSAVAAAAVAVAAVGGLADRGYCLAAMVCSRSMNTFLFACEQEINPLCIYEQAHRRSLVRTS
jgi:hypothetical protein